MTTTIHVTGDAYWAYFFTPRDSIFLDGVKTHCAHAHPVPVGVEYICRAIKATSNPGRVIGNEDSQSNVEVTRGHWLGALQQGETLNALYELTNVGTMPALDDDFNAQVPLLRVKSAETQELYFAGMEAKYRVACRNDTPPPRPDVLVHWIGELAKRKSSETKCERPCRVHLQVGLGKSVDHTQVESEITPSHLATATDARIIVVNVGEIGATQRVRKSLSYEAIAVDLLRLLRGPNAEVDSNTSLLNQLSMCGKGAAPISVLVVRLNSSAVFLYGCEKVGSGGFKELGSWLLCHKLECAPLSQPELGQMVGYTGFVSAQIAVALAAFMVENPQSTRIASRELLITLFDGVRRALGWQRAAFERGCLRMLFRKKDGIWEPIVSDVMDSSTGYEDMFADIVRSLKRSARAPSGPMPLSCFDDYFMKSILLIQVHIKRAVAHRTQWFMARSVAAIEAKCIPVSEDPEVEDEKIETRFLEIARDWLTQTPSKSEADGPGIPIVNIGEAELTDRREVEDFLAIHQALSIYSLSKEAKPLNIAVFGSPGAGKSFAVNQVVRHISSTRENTFKKNPLTFNLGQFKTLDDLPAALHLVRNECLSREIPIVFFDEFDSSFNGQPFGWLKFFLGPMQDGEFYHAGQNYKLGHAVFVFAGGVNRSFEELNGRVRNPGFCEAKGPDFISRLRAHLNVQGINKSEEEGDQFRYILRRGIILRGIVQRKLRVKKDHANHSLLERRVADALLKIERFKHGVRSLEAIIKMCTARPGHPIGPSDLPSMDQLEMHVDAMKLLRLVDKVPQGPESPGF